MHCVQPEDSAGMLCVQRLGVGLYARRKRMYMLMGNPYAWNVGITRDRTPAGAHAPNHTCTMNSDHHTPSDPACVLVFTES